MHLFYQGLFRHFLKWVVILVNKWRKYCRRSEKGLSAQEKQREAHEKARAKQKARKKKQSSCVVGGTGGFGSGSDADDDSDHSQNSSCDDADWKQCGCCQHTGAASADIDMAFIAMATSASTPHKRFHYTKGICEAAFINNKHVASAMEQLRVVLGSSTHFLPKPVLQR
jgi:hypothetical protein